MFNRKQRNEITLRNHLSVCTANVCFSRVKSTSLQSKSSLFVFAFVIPFSLFQTNGIRLATDKRTAGSTTVSSQ